jgi:hypothetical protein
MLAGIIGAAASTAEIVLVVPHAVSLAMAPSLARLCLGVVKSL